MAQTERSHRAVSPTRHARLLIDASCHWILVARDHGAPGELTTDVGRAVVGRLSVIDRLVGPCIGLRTAREIRADDREFVGVLVGVDGRLAVAQDGRTATLWPGEVVVWDSRRPASFEVTRSARVRTLVVPIDEALARFGSIDGLTAVPLAARSPSAPLLAAHLAVLCGLREIEPLASQGVEAATFQLVASAVRPVIACEQAALSADAHLLAERVIELRLAEPGLAPADVAKAVGTSLRALQLAFAAHGDTVATAIRRRRLDRARAELLAQPGRSVTEIAFACGFTDSGRFATTFRRAYGLTPSELRRRTTD